MKILKFIVRLLLSPIFLAIKFFSVESVFAVIVTSVTWFIFGYILMSLCASVSHPIGVTMYVVCGSVFCGLMYSHEEDYEYNYMIISIAAYVVVIWPLLAGILIFAYIYLLLAAIYQWAIAEPDKFISNRRLHDD